MKTKGKIFNLQHFSIHDGPGIRTTVFFKGCPLRCRWCHNPESWESRAELSFNAEKCIGCQNCFTVCVNNAHVFDMDKHTHNIDREKCKVCGECVKKCYHNVLDVIGNEYTVDEVLKDVLSDEVFYSDGGGMTLSGGEPMVQYEFVFELLKSAKSAGLNNCIETCGYCDSDKLKIAANYVDLFLFDYKETDSIKHKEFTGVDNRLILENLRMLDSIGKAITLRCPIIPTFNDNKEHFKGISDLANSLKNLVEVNLEPYHPLGISKSANIGKNSTFNNRNFINNELMNTYLNLIKSQTDKKIIIM